MIKPEDYLAAELRVVQGLLPKGQLTPKQRLQYAIDDLAEESSGRTWSNAITNAKRALLLHVEMATHALGFMKLQKKPPQKDGVGRDGGFPAKLDFLGRCGIASPEVLSVIVKIKNAIEHDYFIPANENVAKTVVKVVADYLEETAGIEHLFFYCSEWRYEDKVFGKYHLITSGLGSGIIDVWDYGLCEHLDAFDGPKEERQDRILNGERPPGQTPMHTVSIRENQEEYFQWARLLAGGYNKLAG